jgi:serine/threonine protein kinase/anti-anti-sigma regulatory factor
MSALARIGRYQLLERIAQGGMAEIFLAIEVGVPGTEKLVAVKRILSSFAQDDRLTQMFLEEARIMARLSHPNLIKLFEVIPEPTGCILAMEYLEGKDLRLLLQVVQSAGVSIPLEVSLAVAMQAASGLHHAHTATHLDGQELRLVHRDISPHNLFLTYEGHLKILDFGVAKTSSHMHDTEQGVVKGKIPYMSPEQCCGEELDQRSDLFSLGIIVYELITGEHPFRRENGVATLRAVVSDPIPPPSSIIPRLSSELDAIILKATERNRSRRYNNALELRQDLERYVFEQRLNVSTSAVQDFLHALFAREREEQRQHVHSILRDVLRNPPPELRGGELQSSFSELLNSSPSHAGFILPVPTPQGTGSLKALPTGPDLQILLHRRVGRDLLQLRGRMQESFSVEAWPDALQPTVVFDLMRVERISSYGVRQWLHLVDNLSRRGVRTLFVRAPEPFIRQTLVVRGFLGKGEVLSVMTPYICESCGASSVHELICADHGEELMTGRPPALPCPACHRDATFDDDASLFAFLTQPPHPLTPELRTIWQDLASPEPEPGDVDKTFQGETTLLRVAANLDPHLRWDRVLHGLEGDVFLTFAAAGPEDAAWAPALAAQLATLRPQLTRLRIERSPLPLVQALRDVGLASWVDLRSVLVTGVCHTPGCQRTRTAEVDAALLQTPERTRAAATCRRCGQPVALDLPHLLQPLQPSPVLPTPTPPAAPHSAPLVLPAPTAPLLPPYMTAIIALLALVVAALLALLLQR